MLSFRQFLESTFDKVIPPKEDVYEVMDANLNYGFVKGNELVNINQLVGGITPDKREKEKVETLAKIISSPHGYFERIIVDDRNEVLEGQHRLEALKLLGVQQVPILRVIDMANFYNVQAMDKAIQNMKPIHPDQRRQIIQRVLESILDSGSPEEALRNTFLPPPWQDLYVAALKAAKKIS